jgi:hypothetical protein
MSEYEYPYSDTQLINVRRLDMNTNNNYPPEQKSAPRQQTQTFVADTNFQVKKASRRSVKVKIAMSGASGSGKTLGSLLVANGLCSDWNKIAFIDTENESAAYYVGRDFEYRTKRGIEKITIGEFHHLPLSEQGYDPDVYQYGPYHPRRFVAAMRHLYRTIPGLEVIIIDSGTHEWEGAGGCLDMQTQMGGQYQDWAKVTPHHKAFIDAMRDIPAHVIMTMRSKSDVVIELNAKGKTPLKRLAPNRCSVKELTMNLVSCSM